LYNTSANGNNLFNNSTSLLNSNFNNLTKDFETSYLIRANGTLTARYSYRVLNTTTLNTIDQLTVQYVNGLGLVYQKDFDTPWEFFRSLLFLKPKVNAPANTVPSPANTPTATTVPLVPGNREDQEN